MKFDATLVAFVLFAAGPPAAIVWAAARDGGDPFTPRLVGPMVGCVAVAAAAYALVRAAERRWPEALSPAMEIRRYVAAWLFVVALLGGMLYAYLLIRG